MPFLFIFITDGRYLIMVTTFAVHGSHPVTTPNKTKFQEILTRIFLNLVFCYLHIKEDI